MNKWKIASLAFVLSLSSVAQAQSRKIDRALTHEFGEAEREVVHEREINGVKVYDIRIHAEQETTVSMTHEGEVMSRTTHVEPNWLPRLATETLKSMFREQAHRVRRAQETSYLVDVVAGHRVVRLQLDPAGRVVNVLTRKQIIDAEDFSDLTALEHRDQHAVHELLEKCFENVHVKGVYAHPETEGFFIAEFTYGENHTRTVLTMDARKDVVNYRSAVDANELPAPVQATIASMFHDAEIRHAQRSTNGFYTLEERVGAEELTIRIDATGNVLAVHAKDRENFDSADAR